MFEIPIFAFAVFVYGATGAGKTHTMLGSTENPGLTFKTVMELYSRLEALKEEITCEVAVSYVEVYNETVIDLIKPGQQLAIREDGHTTNILGMRIKFWKKVQNNITFSSLCRSLCA